jgi:hypothetical protein
MTRTPIRFERISAHAPDGARVRSDDRPNFGLRPSVPLKSVRADIDRAVVSILFCIGLLIFTAGLFFAVASMGLGQ